MSMALASDPLSRSSGSTDVVEPFPFLERQQQVRWNKLAAHMEENFHAPDLEAIRVMMSAAASHHLWPQASPVWIMLIGASGSGKTSQVMPALQAFEGFRAISHLTKATFLSGWRAGEKGETGLLKKCGDSVIFGVSDFTGISTMSKDNLAEVLSQMRQMYDGEVSKNFGTGHHEEWKGKATMLACTTPEIERRFRLWDSLGARFLLVRWRMGDPELLALKAAEQERQVWIKEQITELAREFLGLYREVESPGSSRGEMEELGLQKAAALVARLRKPVTLDGSEIVENVGGSDSEGPGRIMQATYNVARAHATLFRRTQVTQSDIQVGLRVARETVPLARWRLMELVAQVEAEGKDASIASLTTKLMERRDETQTTSRLEKGLRELVVVGALSSTESGGQRWWRTTDWVRERLPALMGRSND